MITSRSAALVAGCGSRKTVLVSSGSKSKHEHASRRTGLFSWEVRRALASYGGSQAKPGAARRREVLFLSTQKVGEAYSDSCFGRSIVTA